jgi:lipopolysaccharide biosynthesis glycosyltransferase
MMFFEKGKSMEESPLVSIITVVPDINRAGHNRSIKKCIRSVRRQTYKNIEHIVIDKASIDGTLNLFEKYSSRGLIRYISGSFASDTVALNKGIDSAKGEIIAFLDINERYHNINTIRVSVNAIVNSGADFSYADSILVDRDKIKVLKGELKKFLYTTPFAFATMFLKKDVILKLNKFDETYEKAFKYDFVQRLILGDRKGTYIKQRLVVSRYDERSGMLRYGDEIAKIFIKNYSPFYRFHDERQAKKIVISLALPDGFTASLRLFLEKANFKNIDQNEILSAIIGDLSEQEQKNDVELLGNQQNGIPVFLSSDDNYAPFVATTICSIMEHTSSFVSFYILDGGISSKNAQKIKQLRDIYSNIAIEFIEIDTQTIFKDFPTREHFSIDMYTRFLIPELKSDLKKVVYSDVDVIFNDDIKKLYDEDLNGYSIGAVPYLYGYINPNKEEINSYHLRLGLPENHKYFESGLLLIDIDSWKKDDLTKKLIDQAGSSSVDSILRPDQDVLNIVFANNYKQLDNKYIVDPNRANIMKSEFRARNSIENPFVIHYAGREKPWNNIEVGMSEYFWKYARKTPFYEELLFNMSQIMLKNYSVKNKKGKNRLNEIAVSIKRSIKRKIKKILLFMLNAYLY